MKLAGRVKLAMGEEFTEGHRYIQPYIARTRFIDSPLLRLDYNSHLLLYQQARPELHFHMTQRFRVMIYWICGEFIERIVFHGEFWISAGNALSN